MKISSILPLVLSAAFICSCDKNEYLPPDWNYDIPQTPLTAQTCIGAFYSNKNTPDWQSASGYTPILNLVYDEDAETPENIPYQSTADGILTRQCEYAAEAGIDFFIINWNNGDSERNLKDVYEIYYTENTHVKLAINYNFSHLRLSSLTDSGEDFDRLVGEFRELYESMFSKEWYYRLPSGRPVIIFSGMKSDVYDYSLFIPAFRKAMEEFTEQLKQEDASIDGNVLNFYIMGENTANWPAPQTNSSAARWLDANFTKKWFPAKVYERWTCFYPFTDMAWQNWSSYCREWGCDFVPCIYPEYYTAEKATRSIERSIGNYTDFCNVAKRNIGSQNIILIDSWNDFTNDTALEPTVEYGETYIGITRSQLKL